MRYMLKLLALLALAAPSVPLAAQAAPADSLNLRAVRYFRAAEGRTRVMVFIEVPYSRLQPGAGSASPQLVYTVTARVLDSSGLSLLPEPQVWTQHVPASLQVPGAVGLEMMEFGVTPGSYRLEIEVRDSASGATLANSAPIRGYDSMPGASDLLLSPSMRIADDGDSVPAPGEMRRGNTLLVPAAVLQVTPLRTTAYYFLETYTGSAAEANGTMTVAVMDSAGGTVLKTSPEAIRLAPGGGIVKGRLDLDGLPAGRYRMNVEVTVGGDRSERSAPFIMAGLQETMAKVQAAPATPAAAQSDEAFFAAMDEAKLDSMAEPLQLIASGRELRNFSELTVSAKRRFLAEFWSKLDQTPETPPNEERQRFYGAIAFANEQYRVGRGEHEPGWKTDRGRIYARYGAPDDRLRRVPTGEAPPYEVWRYTRGKSRYYIFADLTGFGAFKLIQTNDNRETGLPHWRDIITEFGVRDAGLFLGVDFYSGAGAGS
ncbi:MAG TPA: GWxTD domain-containing protein [Gemmatimonadales bacterium]|nr:GWxTD domain-containing protein [Gemmatimonadales bacterium]